ncbi:hypothetical protein [Litchfieldia alkalitelluris]|uniref:hypothetical protein n=1 Tax=Litchfieldia alkalitelluris TaxID=304268 RepID=UPI000996C601|nr:hypothetical protein [Litchfieldia alkalitelluris]
MRKSIISLSAAAMMTLGLVGCAANDDTNFNTQNNGNVRVLDRGNQDNDNIQRYYRENMNGNGYRIDENNGRNEILGNDNNHDMLENNNKSRNNGNAANDRDTMNVRGTRPGSGGIGGTTGTGGTR